MCRERKENESTANDHFKQIHRTNAYVHKLTKVTFQLVGRKRERERQRRTASITELTRCVAYFYTCGLSSYIQPGVCITCLYCEMLKSTRKVTTSSKVNRKDGLGYQCIVRGRTDIRELLSSSEDMTQHACALHVATLAI